MAWKAGPPELETLLQSCYDLANFDTNNIHEQYYVFLVAFGLSSVHARVANVAAKWEYTVQTDYDNAPMLVVETPQFSINPAVEALQSSLLCGGQWFIQCATCCDCEDSKNEPPFLNCADNQAKCKKIFSECNNNCHCQAG